MKIRKNEGTTELTGGTFSVSDRSSGGDPTPDNPATPFHKIFLFPWSYLWKQGRSNGGENSQLEFLERERVSREREIERRWRRDTHSICSDLIGRERREEKRDAEMWGWRWDFRAMSLKMTFFLNANNTLQISFFWLLGPFVFWLYATCQIYRMVLSFYAYFYLILNHFIFSQWSKITSIL